MSDLLFEELTEAGYRKSNAFMFNKLKQDYKDTNPYKDGSMVGTEGGEILGIGQSAHSLVEKRFAVNPYTPMKYVEMIERDEELTYICAQPARIIDIVRNFATYASQFGRLANPAIKANGRLSYFDKWQVLKSFQAWSGIYTIIRNWNTQSRLLGFSTLIYQNINPNAPTEFITEEEAAQIQIHPAIKSQPQEACSHP